MTSAPARVFLERTTATAGADGVRLAKVERTGLYQLGGATEDFHWQVDAPASTLGPLLEAGTTHAIRLERGQELHIVSAGAATTCAMWLVWPDEEG